MASPNYAEEVIVRPQVELDEDEEGDPAIVREELLESDEEDDESEVSHTTSVQNRLQEVKQAFTDIRRSMAE